jgi:hypothetical protein
MKEGDRELGPFVPNVEPAERLARWRSLQALAGVFCHRYPDFIAILRAAESARGENRSAGIGAAADDQPSAAACLLC